MVTKYCAEDRDEPADRSLPPDHMKAHTQLAGWTHRPCRLPDEIPLPAMRPGLYCLSISERLVSAFIRGAVNHHVLVAAVDLLSPEIDMRAKHER